MVLVDLMIPNRQASGKYYVYLFVVEGTDYYKIGYTNHIYKRLSAVNTSSPQAVACIQYYAFTYEHEAVGFEKYLHKCFAEKRLRNRITKQLKEWFTLTITDVNQISRDYQDFTQYLQRGVKPVPNRLKEAFDYASKKIKSKLSN